jgi:predicted nuclease with TOPRIM domain
LTERVAELETKLDAKKERIAELEAELDRLEGR